MRIALQSAGGIGNLRIGGELEVDSLAPELRAKLEQLLHRLGTEQLTEADNPHMTDAMSYELTVFSDDDASGARRFVLDETKHDREALGVCKELLREVVNRKRGRPQQTSDS